jgi:hypothetical protein
MSEISHLLNFVFSSFRIFFPDLWSKKELENWGITNLDGHETLKTH